jgi:hypothetical protein
MIVFSFWSQNIGMCIISTTMETFERKIGNLRGIGIKRLDSRIAPAD